MEERYIRNLGALTEEECALLRTKTVFVAGCGGLGGYLIEMLLRLGVGAIRAADGDAFEASNLNRQLLSSPQALGHSKAEAAAARAAQVNPEVRFEAIPAFVTEENAARLIRGCDAVLGALDNIGARRTLARACAKAGARSPRFPRRKLPPPPIFSAVLISPRRRSRSCSSTAFTPSRRTP